MGWAKSSVLQTDSWDSERWRCWPERWLGWYFWVEVYVSWFLQQSLVKLKVDEMDLSGPFAASHFITVFTLFWNFLDVYGCYICKYIWHYVHTGTEEARECHISENWSYRCLRAAIWVLGTGPGYLLSFKPLIASLKGLTDDF